MNNYMLVHKNHWMEYDLYSEHKLEDAHLIEAAEAIEEELYEFLKPYGTDKYGFKLNIKLFTHERLITFHHLTVDLIIYPKNDTKTPDLKPGKSNDYLTRGVTVVPPPPKPTLRYNKNFKPLDGTFNIRVQTFGSF